MRFMATSLSSIIDNFMRGGGGGTHKLKCKTCGCFLEYKSVQGNLIKYNYSSCYKEFLIKLDEELMKKFRNTFEFSKNNINNFILLLRKGIYRQEYMDDWKKLIEKELPEEKNLQQIKLRRYY